MPADTLPPRCDFPVCISHIIAAASAAAISRFLLNRVLTRREPFRSLLWDGEASAGCGLARPARQEVKQEAPAGAARGGDGEHGNEQGACDCEPGAASAAGLGRGRGEAVKRRDAGAASAVGLTLMLTLLEG
nr:hypothetical protein KXZ65_05930 [Pectobacterium sp. PL152]